jgi:hypothetical protein
MELSVIFGAAVVVTLIWWAVRPKAQRPRRRSDRQRLWDRTPGTESAAWFGLWGGNNSSALHDSSEHPPHDGGSNNNTTNAPADGGSFDEGGGGEGGGGIGGGH